MPSSDAIAFLFPGQGSQFAGMGQELAAKYPVARRTFEEADAALGFSLSQLCFAGPEEQLKLTENTQPAILTVSVATLRVLREKGYRCQYAAGHSLGEYSALVAAGTLTFADAVRTVRKRGRYMQEAVPAGQGAMAAILNLAPEIVAEVCQEASAGEVVQPANINSAEQIVISGHQGAVERAAALAKQRGAKRAILLPVSAPFHCPLMQPAQDRLTVDLRALTFHDPEFPVLKNIDAEPVTTGEAAREALILQVTGAVQWERSMRALIASGIQYFVEIGPGEVLSGLIRRMDRTRTTCSVQDEASLQKLSTQIEVAQVEAMAT
jgi:[acyl-carrier-protein] S-malonyltransferase